MNVAWDEPDGTRYSLVQYKPGMVPHIVITRPGDSPRGRPATDDELAMARQIGAANEEGTDG